MNTKSKGILYMLLASFLFATGGLVIKLTDWNAFAINGIRSLFGLITVGIYMIAVHHPVRVNKTVLLGAFSYMAMTTLFVLSNKMTTAGNAIVLQFTCPIWIVIISWILYHKKPERKEVWTMLVLFCGIALFFFDSLQAGHLAGDLFAICSGIFYGILFMINSFPKGDAISSVFLGQAASFLIFGGFSLPCNWNVQNLAAVFWLGAFQVGAAYIFFCLGTARISPLQACLVSGLEPVLNPALVALFWNESLSPLSLCGAVLVVGSIILFSASNAIASSQKAASPA